MQHRSTLVGCLLLATTGCQQTGDGAADAPTPTPPSTAAEAAVDAALAAPAAPIAGPEIPGQTKLTSSTFSAADVTAAVRSTKRILDLAYRNPQLGDLRAKAATDFTSLRDQMSSRLQPTFDAAVTDFLTSPDNGASERRRERPSRDLYPLVEIVLVGDRDTTDHAIRTSVEEMRGMFDPERGAFGDAALAGLSALEEQRADGTQVLTIQFNAQIDTNVVEPGGRALVRRLTLTGSRYTFGYEDGRLLLDAWTSGERRTQLLTRARISYYDK